MLKCLVWLLFVLRKEFLFQAITTLIDQCGLWFHVPFTAPRIFIKIASTMLLPFCCQLIPVTDTRSRLL